MLFASKKSKNNWILHGGRVCLAGKADSAQQSETCRSWEVFLVSGQLKPTWAQLSTPTEHVSSSRWITAPTDRESSQGRDGKGPDPVKKPKLRVQTGCGILKNAPEPCDLLVPSHTPIQSCPLCLTHPSFPGTQQPCPGTGDSLPEESVLSLSCFPDPDVTETHHTPAIGGSLHSSSKAPLVTPSHLCPCLNLYFHQKRQLRGY